MIKIEAIAFIEADAADLWQFKTRVNYISRPALKLDSRSKCIWGGLDRSQYDYRSAVCW